MNLLRPDASYRKLADVPFEAYARKFRYVFLDADNTLQIHGLTEVTPEAAAIVRRIEASGMQPVLYSNASAARAGQLASGLGIPLLAGAAKPSGRPLRNYLAARQWDPAAAVVIGDQLFTDLWAGRLAGTAVVKVRPLSRDEAWWIKAKRFPEMLCMKTWGDGEVFDDLML